MIRINLLPYRAERKKENIRRQVGIYTLSVMLVALGCYYYHLRLNSNIKRLNSEINYTNAQVAKYKKINREIEEIKKKLAVLERKTNVIKSLDADRKAPVHVLDELYHLLVEKRMWYTGLTEKNNQIKIQGVALDNQTVADFMTRLEKSKQFNNVRLASIRKETIRSKNIDLKKFEVAFNRVVASSVKTQQKKGKKR